MMRETEPDQRKAAVNQDSPATHPRLVPAPRPRFLGCPALRYQDEYVWFIFFAAMDIMLTWYILERRGGEEVNPVADAVIASWGLWGAIGFKFSLVLFVIIACEWISRDRPVVAHRLVWTGIAISAVPVFYSLSLLLYHWQYPINS
ncbi:MAG: hypothetical protein EXS17_03840 [Phycisphaerales bacterium]|nr:hypothetical protein [Phycisphaerales bacterium]